MSDERRCIVRIWGQQCELSSGHDGKHWLERLELPTTEKQLVGAVRRAEQAEAEVEQLWAALKAAVRALERVQNKDLHPGRNLCDEIFKAGASLDASPAALRVEKPT